MKRCGASYEIARTRRLNEFGNLIALAQKLGNAGSELLRGLPASEADQTGKADPLRSNENEKSFIAFQL